MDPILKSLGYTQGSVGQRMQALGKDPRYKFSEGDKGRDEIMAYIQTSAGQDPHACCRGRSARWSRAISKSSASRPRQKPGAPAAYGGAGSIDGKIPGKFWINLRTTDLHRKYNLPDLAAHEAIPGHVWQGEYANKLPLIRTLLAFNAYSEGWALYAEQLVDELGVYDDFPVGRLGYLQSIAFRCCRLVVDTGLHAKRWTRQQARRVLRQHQRLQPARSRQRSRPLLRLAGPGLRLQGRPQRHRPPARQGEGRARAEVRPRAHSTMPWSWAATCRWTCSRRTSTITSPGRSAPKPSRQRRKIGRNATRAAPRPRTAVRASRSAAASRACPSGTAAAR